MKNLSYFFIFFFLVFCSDISYGAYCSTTSLSSINITPESFNQSTATFNSGRRAFVFTATAGCTYTFSTCGASTMDTYLRLYSGAGGTLLVSADDNCGLQSQIVWTCPTTGTYSVLLTRYSCNALNSNVYMNYSKSCPTPCSGTVVNLTMNDSWGDGWNGGSITLINNSGGSYGPYTISTGLTGSASLCLPDGCYNISVAGGTYPGEMTWSLSNGISGGGSYGTQNNVFTIGSGSCGPIFGCMDPNSLNYNPAATVSNGSCYYGVPTSGTKTLSTCGATIYDNGGPASTYSANSNGQLILYPATSGATIQLNFTSFAVENNWDYLYIYNGNSTAAPLLGTYTGATAPTQVTSTATNGALTLVFTSDGSVNYDGFSASVSCVSPPPPNVSSISTIESSGISINDGNICVGSPVQLIANGAVGTVFWFTNSCGAIGQQIGTGNSIMVSPTSSTTYYARNYNGSLSSDCAYATVNVYSNPTANAGLDQATCAGSNMMIGEAVVSSGSQTFTWTATGVDGGSAGNYGAFVEGTTSGLPVGSVITSVSYSTNIDYNNQGGNGYCGTWWSANLFVNNAIASNACDVTNAALSSLNGQPANNQTFRLWLYDLDNWNDNTFMSLEVTINWSLGNSFSWNPASGLNNPNISNPIASPLSTTNYTLTVTTPSGCSATDQVLVAVNNPTLATAPANGDMVWRGASSNDWATIGNWWQYNGSNYIAATAAPTPVQNVVIPMNQTCVLNQPNTNANIGTANSLRIENGATLTMGTGNLSIAGNWVNNGSFVPGTGTVTFAGSGTHTVSGTAANHNFNDLTMNKTGEVQLSVPITMSGTLTLTNGRLNIGNLNLDLPTNTINGGNANSYVLTSGTGVLMRNVGASTVSFPVGRAAYNPAALTNSGVADKFSVRVIDNVTDNGDNADTDPTTTMAVVNRTWMVDEQTAGGSNVTLRLNWNGAGEQINGFQGANAFIAHYFTSEGLWDNIGGTVPSLNVIETSGITSFSPFTISSDNAFAPLPVELIAFSAHCQNDDVEVKWSTASEHNSQHFTLQVSEDGMNWSNLYVAQGAGFSNTVVEYSYVHANAARAKNYYRLIQYDYDGAYETYNTIMSNCSSDDAVFMTFPNPSVDAFTVVVNDELLSGANVLTISDASGKVLYSIAVELENGSGSFALEDLDLPAGLYYLQLNNGSHTSRVIKHSFR